MTIRNIKIILLGEKMSGKSSLISNYLFGHPTLPKKPTLFGSYCREITVNNEEFRLNICDSSGGQDFQRLQAMSYLDADLLAICVDCTQKGGLRRASEDYADKTKISGVPTILCLTKIDLESAISNDEIEQFVQKHQLNGVIRCTSNDNRSVIDAFEEMIKYAKSDILITNRSCCGLFSCCK